MTKQIQASLFSIRGILVITLIALLSLAIVFATQPGISTAAATSSTQFAGTSAEDTSVGSVSWSNYSNATASDDSRVTVESVGGYTTYYIKATNFGFNIPTGSTIDGIIVEVEKQVGNGGTGNTKDNSVRLVKGGTISGDDNASASNWPANGSESFVSYGGTTDLWGLTFDAADINASTFGAVIAAQSTDGGTKNFEVDSIRITVHYTEGPALFVSKSEGETRTSTTTFSNDADLVVGTLEANKTYILDGLLLATSTSGTPDLKMSFDIPSGAVIWLAYQSLHSGQQNADLLIGTSDTDPDSGRIQVEGDGDPSVIHIRGTLEMGATTGNATLQWAQFVSNANNTTIGAGSYLRATKIE